MKLESSWDRTGEEQVHTLRISRKEMVEAHLYPWDRALFRDCEGSASVADHLLALELLVRRVEESRG